MELIKSTGFDMIITVVNFISKRTHFIPAYITVTMKDITRLFLHYVWKHHGLLTCIVLDKELQFVVPFMKELYYLLKVKIILSTV